MNYVAHADSWSSLKILDYYKKLNLFSRKVKILCLSLEDDLSVS